MTEPNLVAFLGGVAASGAKYKIEIILVGNGIYQADAYSAGGSTAWTRPTLIERSALQPVLAKALAKFAAKTVPGRDRTYDMPLTGLPSAGPIGKALVGGDLPNHPLAWEVGRSLLNLPREYHDRAVLRPGQAAAPVAAAGSIPPPVATPVSTAPAVGSRTDLGQLVMLCETLNTEP